MNNLEKKEKGLPPGDTYAFCVSAGGYPASHKGNNPLTGCGEAGTIATSDAPLPGHPGNHECTERMRMAIKIGVISDTHGLLRPAVLEVLKSCDYILHGGNVNKPEILDTLRDVAPLYVVRDNNDKEWAEDLPAELAFSIGGVIFYGSQQEGCSR